VNKEKLKATVGWSGVGYTTTGRRDHELIKAILAEKSDMIKYHIMDNCPVKEMVSDLTHLVATCKRLVVQDITGSGLQLYDQTMCSKFHQLVVATLLAYGKVLDALYATWKKEVTQNKVTLA